MSIDFKRCKNTEPARSQKTKQTMQKKPMQFDGPTRAWFPFGPNNDLFSRSQWWASSRAQPIGSPLADRPMIQRCGVVLVIQWTRACTQPAHRIPSKSPHQRAVAWRQGMIGWLTFGARVRRNPAGFRGVLSWSAGFQRLWLSINNLKKSIKYETFTVRRFIGHTNEEKY